MSDAIYSYTRGEQNAARALVRSVVGTAIIYMEGPAGPDESEVVRDGRRARLRLLAAAVRLLDSQSPLVDVDDARQALQAIACEAP